MMSDGLAVRYLELLKAVLTNTLHSAEPDRTAPDFGTRFIDHYFKGRALTCVPRCRLDHLQLCIGQVVEEGIPGDLIEAGVWRGGVTIFMRGVLDVLGVTDRVVWVADSFRGLPCPDETRCPREAAAWRSPEMKQLEFLAASRAEVSSNFRRFGLLGPQVRFLEGWFADTLPSAPITSLAVLRLDGDFYDSTITALTALYSKLSPGGYVIVDDYGEDWTYCRRAVDEFRTALGIREPLESVDPYCWIWRKARC